MKVPSAPGLQDNYSRSNPSVGGHCRRITNVFDSNLIFCELKPHAQFHNPWTTPSGRKVTRENIQVAMKGEENSGIKAKLDRLYVWSKSVP